MAKTKEAKLKKCPFCGENAVWKKGYGNKDYKSLRCVNCGYRVSTSFFKDEAEAITAWNSRPLEADLLAALEKISTYESEIFTKGIGYDPFVKKIAKQAILQAQKGATE